MSKLCLCLNNLRTYVTKQVNKTELPIFQYSSNENSSRVYVWGLANTGALGIPKVDTKDKEYVIKKPKRLSFAEKHKVTDVTCGYGFSVFAVESSDVKLYGTGINTDSQISYHESKNKKSLELLLYPSPIRLPSPAHDNTKVLKLSAGRAHLLILTTEGLFTLGSNSYGQCGREIIHDEMYKGSGVIYHIADIDGQKITDVQCGQDHSLVVTESGEVYSCGWGADGQTGLGHYDNMPYFSKVMGDIQGERITKLSCAADCVLAMNDKNEIFGWGNSEYGQLQVEGTEQQINVSKHLSFCKEIGKVVDIASGGSFCMALNDTGHIYVWGYGMLGRGLDYNYSKPWLIPPVLFGLNDFQPDNKVTAIYCGISHLAAVTTLGDLFMWGRNRCGCLGIGQTNNQRIPLKVAVGASVIKISCGIDHTIAICQPFV